MRSVSEAVFTTNLLRLIRQDRLNIDGMATHMHGAAPPGKHRESARFMEPLLGKVLRTLRSIVPVAKPAGHVNEELERTKRKLQQAGLELTPPAKRRQSQADEQQLEHLRMPQLPFQSYQSRALHKPFCPRQEPRNLLRFPLL